MIRILVLGLICIAMNTALEAVAAASDPLKATSGFPTVEELPVQEGLPDPFVKPDGSKITSTKQWPAQRVYLKAMLAHYVYGSMPPRPTDFGLERTISRVAFDGLAINERYALTLERNGKKLVFHFEFFRPVDSKRRPAIIKNCFALFDADSKLSSSRKKSLRSDNEAALEAVKRGYLFCKFVRSEVTPDTNRGKREKQGVLGLYPEYDWAIIASWAWAQSLVVDALDRLELADMDRIVMTGHSRGGKTALCAGIYDERIAITAPNSSGAGGTASMRYFEEGKETGKLDGEPSHQTLAAVQSGAPNWWNPRWFQFVGKIDRMPFDSHTMKALIAPRALVNPHGRQDYWANPYGTELTYRATDKVFAWLGANEQQGIHWRDGGHGQGQKDWAALLDFADWKFFNKKPSRSFSTLNYPDAKLPTHWGVPPANQPPTPEATARRKFNHVFVKVIVPVTARHPKQDGPAVESWVAEQLKQLGESEYFAVTDWEPICDGLLSDDVVTNRVWNGSLDGQHSFCPVGGDIPERKNGRLLVSVTGWFPGSGCEAYFTLLDEPGNRTVRPAQMLVGKEKKPIKIKGLEQLPYVAVIIAPPPQ